MSILKEVMEINIWRYFLLMIANTLKKYEELESKVRDFTVSITNNSDNYDDKYIKINFNSDDDLPLKKTLELYNMTIVVIFIFQEDNKYYKQAFLNECLYKLMFV